MDITFWAPLIVNFFVAVGTILLAIFAFYSSIQSRKQSEKLEEMQTAQLNLGSPVLRVENFEFKENTLKAKIKNIGNGVAIDVGVCSHFSPAIFIPDSKSKKNTKNKIWGKFSYWPKKLFFNGKESISSGAITRFKFNSTSAEIAPNETIKLEVKPEFFIKFGKSYLASSQSLSFDKFQKFLNENNITFVELVFDLAYKDLSERHLTDRHIARFGYYTKHKNLEEAFKKKINIRISSISLDEYPDFAVSIEMYENIKTRRTFTSKQKEFPF